MTRISPSVSSLRAKAVNERYLVVYLLTLLCSASTRFHSSGENVMSFCTLRLRFSDQLIVHLHARCSDGLSLMPREQPGGSADHGVWVSRASRSAPRIEQTYIRLRHLLLPYTFHVL